MLRAEVLKRIKADPKLAEIPVIMLAGFGGREAARPIRIEASSFKQVKRGELFNNFMM